MNRYEQMFSRLKEEKKGAFIPFVMLLDPDFKTSYEIINALIKGGADALELGIAFSDPVADGPVIQKAALRVLNNKAKVDDAFKLLKKIRDEHPHIPLGILVYANLVFSKGIKSFYKKAKEAGLDSILVADVPLVEVNDYYKEALNNDIAQVLLAPPNLPLKNIPKIKELCSGYTYVVTRKGVTGKDQAMSMVDKKLLDELLSHNVPPLVFGFGISTKEHFETAMSLGASGVISGSKVVSIIEENLQDKNKMLNELKSYVEYMKSIQNNLIYRS